MELLRKVLAIIVGVLILVAVILAARWTGEKIRGNFAKPTNPPVVDLGSYSVADSNLLDGNTTSKDNQKVASYSAIPKTGPAEVGFALMAVSALGGFSSLLSAKKLLR